MNENIAQFIRFIILKKMEIYKKTYHVLPHYVILSNDQVSLLRSDMCVYLSQNSIREYVFGMEIITSERIVTCDDIEIF